ncbi:MAG: hypothetical protein COB20_14510 [SAR86 cluster bacterium]|uniref:Metallo-beta-lactamase domain-containing protein n=1 Tax=SAR86 cluster bacterium TaxID=2030880 RepID=A0A2A4WY82_9GAMM|nr:MAG: hypothetical protein COB20_14510 [SAR86 cluster bacterium]
MISAIQPIPSSTDNTIWAASKSDSRRVCVVDSSEAQPIVEYLESNDLQPSDILITHHHPDHAGGIQELTNRYSCRVAGPSSSGIKGICDFVFEGNSVTLLDRSFSVIEVSCHTL